MQNQNIIRNYNHFNVESSKINSNLTNMVMVIITLLVVIYFLPDAFFTYSLFAIIFVFILPTGFYWYLKMKKLYQNIQSKSWSKAIKNKEIDEVTERRMTLILDSRAKFLNE